MKIQLPWSHNPFLLHWSFSFRGWSPIFSSHLSSILRPSFRISGWTSRRICGQAFSRWSFPFLTNWLRIYDRCLPAVALTGNRYLIFPSLIWSKNRSDSYSDLGDCSFLKKSLILSLVIFFEPFKKLKGTCHQKKNWLRDKRCFDVCSFFSGIKDILKRGTSWNTKFLFHLWG